VIRMLLAALAATCVFAVGGQAATTLDLNALYQAAAPGATINVPAGTHPGSVIQRDPDKPAGSAPVRFVFADGARVDGALNISGPDGLILDNPDVKYLQILAGSSRITVNGFRGESWDIFGASDVAIVGGDIGPCVAEAGKACVPRIAGAQRVTVDRHEFHNITSSNQALYHTDGLAIFGSQDVTIKRSRFWGNPVTNIRAQNCCGNPPLKNLLIEGNWFGVDSPSNRDGGIEIDNPMPGLVIRNNSFDEATGIQMEGNWTGAGARVVGNLYRSAGCYPGVSYEANYFIPFSQYTGQTACGTNRKVTTFGYRDQAASDFRLTAASPVYAQRDLYEQAAPGGALLPPPPPPPVGH
jgi:Right handed beta helix region